MRTALTTGLAAAALLLAGCAQEPGTANPATDTTPAPEAAEPEVPGAETDEPPEQAPEDEAADLPHSGAPAVNNPLDTATFEDDPCLSLDEDMLDAGGFVHGETKSELTPRSDPICHWRSEEPGGDSFGVRLDLSNPEGMSAVYAHHEEHGLELFEERPAHEGHPIAVAEQSDARDLGICTVALGLRDDLAANISVSAEVNEDRAFDREPCEAAEELAGLVVDTMQEAQ